MLGKVKNEEEFLRIPIWESSLEMALEFIAY